MPTASGFWIGSDGALELLALGFTRAVAQIVTHAEALRSDRGAASIAPVPVEQAAAPPARDPWHRPATASEAEAPLERGEDLDR